jgi:hypothetical protein
MSAAQLQTHHQFSAIARDAASANDAGDVQGDVRVLSRHVFGEFFHY